MSRILTFVLAIWMFVTVIIPKGCDYAQEQQKSAKDFSLSQDHRDLIPNVQDPLLNILKERFGDPSQPLVPEGLPVEDRLVQGRQVYVKQCSRCHGKSGDGAGLASKKMDVKPRDFRLGVFKWRSTQPPSFKPLRHDLRETLRIGIPGTAMPSFAEVPEEDRNAVVEYVRWLAMSGEFELRLAKEFGDYSQKEVAARIANGENRVVIVQEANDAVKKMLSDSAAEILQIVQQTWIDAELEENILRPPLETPTNQASIRRGRELFNSQQTKCFACHGETGKGDGLATKDIWPNFATGQKFQTPGLHNAWGHLNQPWDLSTGLYRGGNSSEDLYRRISAGIGGVAMPYFSKSVLSNEQIWDLVHYVQSLRPEKPVDEESKSRKPPPVGKSNAK